MDVLLPAYEEFNRQKNNNQSTIEAFRSAVSVGNEACSATKNMIPKLVFFMYFILFFKNVHISAVMKIRSLKIKLLLAQNNCIFHKENKIIFKNNIGLLKKTKHLL